MKIGRRLSKRVPLKRKYSIQKKVKEHKRKMRKAAKQLKRTGFVKHRKIVSETKAASSIPSAWPRRNEELERIRKERDERVELRREAKRVRKTGVGDIMKKANTKDTIIEDLRQAQAREMKFMASKLAAESAGLAKLDGVRINRKTQSFSSKVMAALERSDMVIEVLDARDPIGSSSETVRSFCQGNKKAHLWVLNKCDLVPKEVVTEWMAYFKNSFGQPVVPFSCRSCTLDDSESMRQSSRCEKLYQFIKLISKDAQMKICVVGQPNVGKSNIVNSLVCFCRGNTRQARSTIVGSRSGTTKAISEISLDAKIKLLDTPGVIRPVLSNSSSSTQEVALVLRQCINIEDVTSPLSLVEKTCATLPMDRICLAMKVPLVPDAKQLLHAVATATGKMKRFGVPDLDAAARKVLVDLSQSKLLGFYASAPSTSAVLSSDQMAEGSVNSAVSIASALPALDLDNLVSGILMCDDGEDSEQMALIDPVPLKA